MSNERNATEGLHIHYDGDACVIDGEHDTGTLYDEANDVIVREGWGEDTPEQLTLFDPTQYETKQPKSFICRAEMDFEADTAEEAERLMEQAMRQGDVVIDIEEQS